MRLAWAAVEDLSSENGFLRRENEMLSQQKANSLETKKRMEDEYFRWKKWGERILRIDEQLERSFKDLQLELETSKL